MVVVGGGRASEMLPLGVVVVAVVVVETWHVVMVMVMVMRICTLTRYQMVFDPGWSFKATFNREHDLLLSRLLLPY